MNYTHTGNFALVTTATVGLQYISDHFYSLNQMSMKETKYILLQIPFNKFLKMEVCSIVGWIAIQL